MPSFHVPDELLLAYAAGNLSEATSLMVATHLAYCPACRGRAATFERVGGALLEDIRPVAVRADGLDRLFERLDGERPDTQLELAPAPTGGTGLPQPLRGYLGRELKDVAWSSVGLGIEEFELPAPGSATQRTKLMRLKAGYAVPRHTHRGSEFTLVLAGGFTDVSGHYLPGDMAVADEDVDHKPVADPGEDCICFIVVDGSIRLTGPIGRLLNPFLR
jgi:putative transcriptional regulator